MNDKAYMVPSPFTPGKAVEIDPEICNGCRACVEVCRMDVLVPHPEKGKPPIVLYPDECWFCACCVEECPRPGAIRMEHPLNQRVGWKRKETGEYFRIGMRNPPPPYEKPPVG
jgi:NAD-dependent dihydropyrimidine dehydrogenase PreA subunit